jgi:hypothetical protein
LRYSVEDGKKSLRLNRLLKNIDNTIIGRSSSGRTTGSEPVNPGSNPGLPANKFIINSLEAKSKSSNAGQVRYPIFELILKQIFIKFVILKIYG